ncbi:hypothetical protein AURDEDRAFT_126178 [Auricularia subglabra TFB-10046 SS5]|nr:hypothetical protein AURDEDRAFT_126178 [Auricularia subglabra TFB-10046 SS5]
MAMGDPVFVTKASELPNGYTQMFALSWFLYDYVLTVDDEGRRITWNAVLFLACAASHKSCDIFDWFESIGTFVLFFFVQCILQARIYAMYDRSRTILYSNIALFVLEAIVAGIVTAFYFGDAVRVIVPSWVLGSCFTERRTEFAGVWAAPLAFESYLAFLAIRKMFQVYESLKALDGMSLIALMVRDNIIYFLMIVAAMMVNLFIFAFKPGLNPGVSVITIVHAAGAIGGTRIVLSLLRNAETSVRLSSSKGTAGESATSGFAFGGGQRGTDLESDTIVSLPAASGLEAAAEAAILGDARQWGSLSSAAGTFAPWTPANGDGRQWGWTPGAGPASEAGRKESLPLTVWSESSTRRGSAVPLLSTSAESSRRGSVWSDATRRGSAIPPEDKIDEKDEETH